MDKRFTQFSEAEERLVHAISSKRVKIEIKHPLMFGLMTTFGFVSILYGFQKLIDRVPLFVHNPWIPLVAGIIILLATGKAYKKLN